MTPLAAISRGLVAGAAGAGVMTAYQTVVMKLRDSEGSTIPAEVAKRIIEGVFQREVPEERMEPLNNATHFLYGVSWGAVYGVLRPSCRGGVLTDGARFAGLVWGVSLVELPAMKLAPPVWKQPPREVALDASYHLAYGMAVAATHAAIER